MHRGEKEGNLLLSLTHTRTHAQERREERRAHKKRKRGKTSQERSKDGEILHATEEKSVTREREKKKEIFIILISKNSLKVIEPLEIK